MPTLPTYTAQLGELPISGGRRAAADEFSGGAAAVAGFARTASKVGEAQLSRTEEEESRKALVTSSEIRAKYARSLDEAQTSGGDLEKLKEQMQADLSAVGDGFQTKKGMDSLDLYTSNTELMFDEQANRIAVTRAASTARLDAGKLMQSASAILVSNPSYLPTAVKDAEALIDGFQKVAPEKKAELKAELRQNLNMAAALSSARIDPEGTKKRLDAGEWELSAEQRQLAMNKSDSQLDARRASENHKRSLAEFERKQRDEVATRKYMGDIVNGTLTGKALERAITGDADLDAASVRTLTLFAEHRAEELVKGAQTSDPTTKKALWLRVYAPEGDPNKIYSHGAVFQAVKEGKLNTTDASALLAGVAGQKNEDGHSFSQRLAQRIRVVDASLRARPDYPALAMTGVAEVMQLEMISRVEKRAAEMRASDTPGGLNALLDSDHKDYFFKPGMMKSIEEDVKRQMASQQPQIPDLRKTPDGWKEVPDGAPFVDPKGVTRTMTPALKAKLSEAPAPAAVTTPGAEFIKRAGPRSQNFKIDAPARSPLRALEGQTFTSEADAQAAIDRVYQGKPDTKLAGGAQ